MSDPAGPTRSAFTAWQTGCTEAGWSPHVTPELVHVTESVGRFTAGPLHAAWSSPAEERAAMDGIAVTAADTAYASAERPVTLPPGRFDLVDTGDPVPPGRDAVVMREHLRWTSGDQVVVTEPVRPGRHVRLPGEDVTRGEPLLPAGHRIRPVDAALVAGAGHTDVAVVRRPVVAIIPTGDEVRPVGSTLGRGDVMDTNSLMLAEMARDLGCTPHTAAIVPDDPAALAAAVTAAAEHADLLLVIAGSSAGSDDHTPEVLASLGKVAVHGVAMRPGHPVVLGVVDRQDPVPVIGVPGYPVAAAQVFRGFAAPMIAALRGVALEPADSVVATLVRAIVSPARVEDNVLVGLSTRDGGLEAVPLSRGAGALSSLARADGVVRVPVGVDGIAAGSPVHVEMLPR